MLRYAARIHEILFGEEVRLIFSSLFISMAASRTNTYPYTNFEPFFLADVAFFHCIVV
jgi:hypothetical protein